MIAGRTVPTRFPETHPFSQDNTMPENTAYIAAWCRAAAAAKRQIEKVTGREWSSWTDSSTRGIGLLPSVHSDAIYCAAWFTSPSHKLSLKKKMNWKRETYYDKKNPSNLIFRDGGASRGMEGHSHPPP